MSICRCIFDTFTCSPNARNIAPMLVECSEATHSEQWSPSSLLACTERFSLLKVPRQSVLKHQKSNLRVLANCQKNYAHSKQQPVNVLPIVSKSSLITATNAKPAPDTSAAVRKCAWPEFAAEAAYTCLRLHCGDVVLQSRCLSVPRTSQAVGNQVQQPTRSKPANKRNSWKKAN